MLHDFAVLKHDICRLGIGGKDALCASVDAAWLYSFVGSSLELKAVMRAGGAVEWSKGVHELRLPMS